MSFTKLDYCQYLLSSQINYTLTNMANHLKSFSHDTIYRYLKGKKLTPRLLFEQVKPMLEQDPQAYLIFDDTVLDKSFGAQIEVTRRQWSGNDKSVIRGIGVVSCVYVNPTTEHLWVIDYRIFDPDADGKTKLDHVREMLGSVGHRGVAFETVLMDSWYATKDLLMLLIEEMQKKYYCPLKSNRQVDDSGGERPYQRVDGLDWNEEELEWGKPIKIKGFPKDYKVKLFRVVVQWCILAELRWSGPSRTTYPEIPCRTLKRRLSCVGRSRSFTGRPQAVDGDRALPVPSFSHPAQPHRVCVTGVEPFETPSLPERENRLPDQARLAA